MNNTKTHSCRSLVYSVFPVLHQADTQIPLINWDKGSQHVNTREDKKTTVGVLYLFYVVVVLCFVCCCSPCCLHRMLHWKGDMLTWVECAAGLLKVSQCYFWYTAIFIDECAAEDVSDLADHFCLQLKGELSITHIHSFIVFFRIIYNF